MGNSQLSPQSVCMSPRPSSSGAIMELGPNTNDYQRSCSPGSLSGGSSSPNSIIGQKITCGNKILTSHLLHQAQQQNESLSSMSSAAAVTRGIRVLLPNSHMVSLFFALVQSTT